jgi:large exoprotein involved in heme utilization and adhesion
VEISGIQTGISAGSSAGANALTDVGDIIVTSRRVSVINGGQITNGSIIGQTGNLTITGTESINVENGGGISSQAFGSPVGTATFSTPNLLINNGFISTSTIGTGNAGPILIDGGATGIVNITNGGQIASNSALAATGSGGNVTLNTGTVTISGTSPTGNPASPLNTNPNSGIYSTAAGTGNAGQINITSSTLNMDSAGTISVATSGAGNAGSVALNVTNFTQTSGARVDSSTSSGGQGGDIVITAANTATISGADTGLFSTASGTGPGGDITLTAGQMVDLNNNGTLSAQSTGTATATAGNITITTPLFQSQNGIVTTGATLADGGNISINTTGSLVYLTDSQITTSVQSGVGGGGNIAIDSELVALDHSGVNADAFGGPGGNINILADVFLSSHSSVTASSALSTSGTIDIQATFTDVSGSLAQLPETPLRATELLRAACAARFAGGKASSLVLAGRDAVPYQPGSLLPSPLYLTGPSAETRTTSQDTKLQFTLLESENRYSSRFSLLPNAHCSL